MTDLKEDQDRAEHDERILFQVIDNVDGIPEAGIVKQSVAASQLVKSTTFLTDSGFGF